MHLAGGRIVDEDMPDVTASGYKLIIVSHEHSLLNVCLHLAADKHHSPVAEGCQLQASSLSIPRLEAAVSGKHISVY